MRTSAIDDPILNNYRFCNIDREEDRVTRYVADVWRNKHTLPEFLYAAIRDIFAARVFNEPKTLDILVGKRPEEFEPTLRKHVAAGNKVFRGAYMMPAHRAEGGKDTIEYWCRAIKEIERLFWNSSIIDYPTLESIATKMMAVMGVGKFLANQVATDLRYTVYGENAPDRDTFVWPGPGTRRGVQRLLQITPLGGSVPRDAEISKVLLQVRADMFYPSVFDDPNNISNAFCEYDKYCRGHEQLSNNKRVTLRKYAPYI